MDPPSSRGIPLTNDQLGPNGAPPRQTTGMRIAIASGLNPGLRIGRFRLVRKLGEGAFAEVWLAVEEGESSLSRKLALKILKPGEWDDESFTSLVDEARVCGHLNHPHVVDVYGVFRDGDTAYIAMEYVPGVTLEALLKRLKDADLTLPLSVVLDIGIQVSEALEHAHNAEDHDGQPLNLVHRDLKPGNIMLAPRGGVKVTDFGLAKTAINSRTTKVGILRGTPSYIAPEVWEGRRDFTPGVDLFALGAIIAEMATGTLLFQGDIPSIIGQALNGSPEADVDELRGVQPALTFVVTELLRRKPEERLGTAHEAATWMQKLRDDLPDQPGGLDLFLRLLSSPSGSHPGRPAPSSSDDPAWSKILSMELEVPAGGGVRIHETVEEIFKEIDVEMFVETAAGAPPLPETNAPSPPPPRAPGFMPASEPGAEPPQGDRRMVGIVALVMVLLWLALFMLWLVERSDMPPTEPGVDPTAEGAPVASPVDPPASEDAAETASLAEGTALAETAPAPVEATPAPPPRPRTRETPAPVITRPAPTPAAVPEPTPAVAPAATPAPVAEATPAPVAAPVDGCLVFKSSPPGAKVWVDGSSTGLMAGSGATVRRTLAPGSYRVGMGIDGPEQTVTVTVGDGRATEVRCDLFGGGCSTKAAGGCN